MSIIRYGITIVGWTYFFGIAPFFFLMSLMVYLCTVLFDPRLRAVHWLTAVWGYQYIWLCPLWKVRFEGVEKIQPGRTYVLIANHQSLIDVPLLFGLFRPFKWVSKEEVFRMPLFGWTMKLNDYVGLARGKKASIAAMAKQCADHLARGSSILIFPEGTRSPDGEIHPFKGGATSIAIRAGVEIVPIVVNGTIGALPKTGIVFQQHRRSELRVRVLDPVSTEGRKAAELNRFLRETMQAELDAMRGRTPAPRERHDSSEETPISRVS